MTKNKDGWVQEKSNQDSTNRLSNGRDYISKKNDRDVNFMKKKLSVMMDLSCQPVVKIRWLQIYLKMHGLKNSSSSIAELSITKTQQIKAGLVDHLKHTFVHFKQYFIHFYTLFHTHEYKKHPNNIIQTPLPNIS